MKKQKRAPRPSKLDQLTLSVAQDYAHEASDDITRRRVVLACEANTVDHEVFTLVSRLADARDRRAKIEATLKGLAVVVGKR